MLAVMSAARLESTVTAVPLTAVTVLVSSSPAAAAAPKPVNGCVPPKPVKAPAVVVKEVSRLIVISFAFTVTVYEARLVSPRWRL